MNINHEHKLIWWAPTRSATKATAYIFDILGFEFYNDLDSYRNNSKNVIGYPSHKIEIPEELNHYKLIMNLRNPYDRILSLFIKFSNVGKNFLYSKDNVQEFIKLYGLFLEDLFFNKNNENRGQNLDILSLDNKFPDFILRSENLIDDLSKLDFVTNSYDWKIGDIHQYVETNKFITKNFYKYNEVYTERMAKLIYENSKKIFILGEYDPFSFTTRKLTTEEKKLFLHSELT